MTGFRSSRKGLAALMCAALGVSILTSASDAAQRPVTADPEETRLPSGDPFDRLDVDGINRALAPSMLRDGPVNVVVEVSGAPVARQQASAKSRGADLSGQDKANARKELKAKQDKIKGEIEAEGGRVLSQMQDAYNGLRVVVARDKLTALAAISGVVGVHVSPTYRRTNIAGAQYVNADDTWEQIGATGDGVRVAIIDTGVDYYHANFAGSGDPADFEADDSTVIEPGTFPTAKVVGGTDFVGDDYDADADDPALTIPHPDPDPLDCNGHGSHVAGSAAGFGVLADGSTFTGPYNDTTYANDFEIGPGVAPEADVLAYRVFGCEGSTNVVVEAINQAVIDGADVINMSLGSPFGTNDNPDADAVENAVAAGVVVVASAGNEADVPYIVGSPSTADHALSVAAVDAMPEVPTANIALTGPPLDVGAINANGADIAAPISADLFVVPGAAPGTIGLGCEAADYEGTAGKIAVTARGVCARVDRAVLGQAAGAVAVVMVNNAPVLPPFEGDIDGVTIPFLGVPSTAGGAFVSRDGTPATITDTGLAANPGFMTLASFSSSGPRSGDSAAKPDVTAPGVSVKSTAVGTGTEGAFISGTSMAAPHASGVAALVVGENPDWAATQVRAAIMNTATTDRLIDTDVHRAGAGAADARRAIDTPVLAMTAGDGASLSYGYDQLAGAFEEIQNITLTNLSDAAVTYAVGLTKQGDLDGYSIAGPGSVTVPTSGTATAAITVSLTEAQAADLPFGSGALASAHGVVELAVTAGEAYDLRVPFVLVPQGLSDVQVSPGFEVENTGIHTGSVDVYALTHADGNDTAGPADIRAVGVQSLPGAFLGLPHSDRALLFAVNTWERWSSPSGSLEVDFAIDTGGSKAPEFFLVSFDAGAILAGVFDGQYASFIFEPDGTIVDAWLADAALDNSTMVLAAAASDFGLSEGDSFEIVDVVGFSLQDDSVDVASGKKSVIVRPWDMPIDQGAFAELAPGESVDIDLDVTNKAKADRLLGWAFVSRDDADGAAQADLVALPAPGKGGGKRVA